MAAISSTFSAVATLNASAIGAATIVYKGVQRRAPARVLSMREPRGTCGPAGSRRVAPGRRC